MFIINNVFKKFTTLGLAMLIIVGSIHSNVEVLASTHTESAPTIHMGDNAPMIRDEFMEWREQRGIRHFNIDGRIYPAGIFFDWANGQSFSYGELNNGILYVTLRPGVVSENRSTLTQEVTNANEPNEQIAKDSQEIEYFSPVIFTDLAPILFSYDELTEMIERVPNQNPLYAISTITIPNRQLTESELTAWITEYNELGGATAFELAVVREINRVRAYYGLHPLALDPILMMSARFKTQEVGDLQYFAHTSPIHGSPTAASRMFGFDGLSISEAITSSGSNGTPEFRTNAERIVGGMLASSRGHREILLNPRTYSVGFGSSFSPNSTGSCGNMSHMFYHATMFGFY